MFRVCPKCNKTVKSDSAAFCYYCGSILGIPEKENGGTAQIPQEKIEPQIKDASTKQSKFPKVAILLPIFMLILAGGYFGYTKFIIPQKVSSEIISPVDSSKEQTFEVDLSAIDIKLSTGTFNVSALAQTAPVSVDSFILLNNPDTFYENFIEENSKVDINGLTGLSVEEIASFLESSFAIITREDSWAFIAKIKNKEFLETKLEEIDTKSIEYEISIMGDFLIISNDVNILSEIANIEEGTSLSLSKDAFFVEAIKNLPLEGAALAFYRDINKLTLLAEKIGIAEKIETKGKNAFIAIKNGKGIILQF